MIQYIDEHKSEHGVEPICGALVEAGVGIAPSTYYASKQRAPSSRACRDRELSGKIVQLHQEHKSLYGVRKMWHLLHREGEPVARCTVSRLMRQLGLCGVVRGKPRITTRPDAPADQVATDLLERQFTAEMPDRAWVADFSYVITYSGTVYVAFVIDCYSRRIVGWKAATSMATSLVLEALEMGLWARGRAGRRIGGGLIHHSDRGSQYTSIAFTERLLEAGVDASVGSVGDAYDNALAESTIGLYKTEVVERRRSWRSFEQVEYAAAEWIDWYNQRRLHSTCGYRPPAEMEAAYYAARARGQELDVAAVEG